jgi:Fic family protein
MTKEPFDRNQPFNQLAPLPPSVEVLDVEVLTQWGLASRALAELNRNLFRLPNPNMLVNTISLQEAKSSSEVENIFTTSDELYKALADTVNPGKTDPSTKEVMRYREALWAGYHAVKKSSKIDLDSIINIYQKIKQTPERIRPPQSQVFIRRGDSEFRAGEIIYTPPRGQGIIEEMLNNLIEYLNEDNNQQPDALIKMAIAHYQFEAIHPFSDGNGRTGRILNILYLIKNKLISYPVLYLSKYIIENKDEYYHRLSAVTQQAAWKPWILYMMRAVEQTSLHTNHLIDTILNQMSATLHYGQQNLKWYKQELNEAIFAQPYLKAKTIEIIMKRTSRTTIAKYLAQLSSLGILVPKEIGGQTFYVNPEMIRILEGQ